MRISLLLIVFSALLVFSFCLHAQTDGDNTTMGLVATNPTVGSLTGFGRGIHAGSDMDQDGKPEIVMTQYNNGGALMVYEVIGDNMLEEVWRSPDIAPNNGYSSPCRTVQVGDLDGNGVDEIITFINSGWNDVQDSIGIVIYQWDGITDDGYVEVARLNHNTFSGHDTSSYRTEDLCVADFDDDGTLEIAWANWVGGSNRFFSIYSVTGDFASGLYVWNQEYYVSRYSLVPGGTGGSMTGTYYGDLDNDGHSEAWVGIYNGLGLACVESSGPDTYADSLNISYVDWIDSVDTYIIKGFVHTDIDGDNSNEIFVEGTHTGRVFLVKSVGDVKDSLNVTELTFMKPGAFTTLAVGDQDHGAGSDGMDIYSGGTSNGIIDYEYVGGALTDSASWVRYEFGADTAAIDTLQGTNGDSLVYVKSPSWMVYVPDIDLDGDGNKEVVASYLVAGSTALQDTTANGTVIPEEKKMWIRIFEFGSLVSGFNDNWKVITPDQYVLKQNYPNPFNPKTNIEFTLPLKKQISLVVYNSLGQKVKTLIDNKTLDAGSHIATWDATNDTGKKVASGMYIYSMKFGNYEKNMRMMLIK